MPLRETQTPGVCVSLKLLSRATLWFSGPRAGATLPFAEPRTGDGSLPEGDAAIVYRHRAGDKRAQAFCPQPLQCLAQEQAVHENTA